MGSKQLEEGESSGTGKNVRNTVRSKLQLEVGFDFEKDTSSSVNRTCERNNFVFDWGAGEMRRTRGPRDGASGRSHRVRLTRSPLVA